MTKKFMVKGVNGPIEADQLATFTYYIQNIQFRFVVTKLPGQEPVVTHRLSGLKVVPVSVYATLGRRDWVTAGKAALDALIEHHGEARVYSVLKAAEADAA